MCAVCARCCKAEGSRTEPVRVMAPMMSPKKAVTMCTPSISAPLSASSMMLAMEVMAAARPTREW